MSDHVYMKGSPTYATPRYQLARVQDEQEATARLKFGRKAET
jgi:hypothetical protein